MPKVSLNDLKNENKKINTKLNVVGFIALLALALSASLSSGYLPL